MRGCMPLGEIREMTMIKMENVSFSYEKTDVREKCIILDDVSFEIQKGQFVAIIGHNGSGKSTIAKLMNGILLPQSGNVFVEGMNTRDDDKIIDIRRRIGMVFQNPDNQIVSNIVEEDVAFAPENLGMDPKEIRSRVDKALNLVEMYDYREHAPHLLSGGQKQRIAIAGVIAMGPDCIVFDEPTAMLDPSGREKVIQIIKKLRENGTTIVLITHHMREIIDADNIIIIDDGKIAKQGTPQEIFKNVDELRGFELDVPETVDLLNELNKSGFNLDISALSIDECVDEIAKAIG